MRISRQVMFMEMAEAAAKRSTCFRGNVGALIVQGNNVRSIGYNGPPAHDEHCAGVACERSATGGCKRSLHAEMNAMLRCDHASSHGSDLYTTSSPCLVCANQIILHGIKRVFFRHPYRDPSGVERLIDRGIEVYKVCASGYVVFVPTDEFIESEAL